MATAEDLLAELAHARLRRSRLLAWARRKGLEYGEKRIINQSTRLIRQTIRRIKKELEALGGNHESVPDRSEGQDDN